MAFIFLKLNIVVIIILRLCKSHDEISVIGHVNSRLERFIISGVPSCMSSDDRVQVKARSLIECGVQCTKHDLACSVLTYFLENKTCLLLVKYLQHRLEEAGCSSYQMRQNGVTVRKCPKSALASADYTECATIPFTYNGVLYNDCADLYPGTSCNVQFCFKSDGSQIICNPHNDSIGKTIVTNINVGGRNVLAPVVNDWIIIQQRVDNNISFRQDWNSYKIGFGDPFTNFWIGLENIHTLASKPSILRLEVLANGYWYADMFSVFDLKDEKQNYRIDVKKHTGDNGDVFNEAQSQDLVIFNSPFSTYDRDNAKSKSGTCAANSGWWFKSCASSNLNAPYDDPNKFRYYLVKTSTYVPITTCRMMVKYV